MTSPEILTPARPLLIPAPVEGPRQLTVITARRFDPGSAAIAEMPAGATIAEIVAHHMAGATPDQLSRTVVTLVSTRGEWEIYARHWSRTRPAAGMTVRIHVRLMGKSILRLLLQVAIFAAASFLGPLVFGAGLPGVLGTAAFGMLGSLALNALIPLPKPKAPPQPGDRYNISSARNEARPYGPIPEPHGKIRFYPPFAALPHTESVGKDRYARFLLNLGYADSVFTDWKIGETPLSEFRDHELLVVKLSPGDPWPIPGYPNPVFEAEEPIKLKQTDGWHVRRTASNVDYISIELLFEAGLGYVDKKGNVDAQQIEFEIERRRVHGDGSLGPYEIVIAPLQVFEGTVDQFRVSHAWLEDEVGQFDVRIRRLTLDADGVLGAMDKVSWVILRGVRPVLPVTFNKPIHLAYLRVLASGQAQGVLDRINCVVSTIRPDFDVPSGTWVTRETQSPAAHARRVIQGPANAFPAPDDEVNFGDIEELARFCHLKGLKANVIHDDEGTVESALKALMRGGRAFPTRHDGLRGCFIDRPQTVVRGHVASANATNFEGEPAFEEPVDALTVTFLDETDSFKQTERVVPRPGLVGAPKSFEQVDFRVYTDPRLVWIEARRLQYEAEFRWERFFAMQDAEHLFAPPGSLVMAHFLTVQQRQASGYVRLVDGSTVVVSQAVKMEAGKSYACRFRSAAGLSYVRTVLTVVGESEQLVLTGGGPSPAVGDLFMFGVAGEEAEEVVVKAIEPQKDFRARLMLVPHAPQIEALAEAEPPEWFPIEPVEREWADKNPAQPVIYSISTVSPPPPADGAPDEKGAVVIVRVKEGPGGLAPTDTILITISGADPSSEPGVPPPDTVRSVTAGIGLAHFHHFVVGDAITVKAQAFSIFGRFSAETAPQAYTVERPDDPPPNVTRMTISKLSDRSRRFRLELDPDAGRKKREDVEGYRIYSRPGAGWSFAELTPLVAGRITTTLFDTRQPLTTGPHVFAAVAVDGAGQESATPFMLSRTLGPSAGPALLIERVETVAGWNGTIVSGALVAGRLVSTVGGTVVYRTPVIDLGSNQAVDIAVDLYVAVARATVEMRTGLAADGGPAGVFRPLEEATARYVELRVTVSNGPYVAALGDIVTTIQPG